jgi:hypothetical protein
MLFSVAIKPPAKNRLSNLSRNVSELNTTYFDSMYVHRYKSRVSRFFLTQYVPKRGKIHQIVTKLHNGHKIYIPNCSKILQMAVKNTNLFHFVALQNLPKLFSFENVPSGNPVQENIIILNLCRRCCVRSINLLSIGRQSDFAKK